MPPTDCFFTLLTHTHTHSHPSPVSLAAPSQAAVSLPQLTASSHDQRGFSSGLVSFAAKLMMSAGSMEVTQAIIGKLARFGIDLLSHVACTQRAS